jgi:hypothetical protein
MRGTLGVGKSAFPSLPDPARLLMDADGAARKDIPRRIRIIRQHSAEWICCSQSLHIPAT